MKKLLFILIFLMSLSNCWAQQGSTTNPYTGQQDMCLWVSETDGSPSDIICGPIKVPNGSLTDNGDGTYSLSALANTECSIASCNLNAATTLNSQGICLADGTDCPAAGSGDVTAVGDCADSACFTGTAGTNLVFNDAGGDGTLDYDGTSFTIDKPFVVTGLITSSVGFDGVGAVDLDYGSADITDHSFTTNDCTFIIDGGITVSTGDHITLGAVQWDNGSDAIDGEQIAADTIDDDSVDFADITCVDITMSDCGAITSSGAVTADSVVANLFDVTGAADMDYGSADVTDHTFTTDDCTLIIDAGITVSTGDKIQIGTTQWNSADEIDGTKIKDADYGDVVIDAAGDWQVSEATALAGDPADCSSNQFANAIAASGALTCAAIGDADVPNNITIDTATLATTVTITDNEDTAENNPLVFVAGGDLDGGNLGLETDGTCYYTPSTGVITATGFVGALTGNASTATALAADPADCGANAVATAIAASGALTCGITPLVNDNIDASSELLAIMDDETGSASGSPLLVFNQNPTINALVGTGLFDLGGAVLEIPNDAAPTVDSIGEFAIDSTSDQLVYYGGAKRVLTYFGEKCVTLEDPVDADDNIPFWHPKQAITITDVTCEVDGGTSIDLTISDGTNALEAITCDGDGAADDGSIANGTFTADERMEFDLSGASGTNTWLNFCITYTITSD